MSLQLTNVHKTFGGVVAAQDVNLTVPPGRMTGLIGPNGAGKTTIVNLITGMLPLTSGAIHVGETDITHASAAEIGRSGLARTFQNIRLLSTASVIDNVMIGFHRHERCSFLSAMLNLPPAASETGRFRDRARALLDEFGLGAYADLPAGGLSYGHQRRVEMARALASEPDYILLDEPIAGMNETEVADLAVIFRGLVGSGKGILLIEHNVRFVSELCEQIYVLDGGRLIASGSPKTVLADPAVVAAYIGT